MNIAELPDFFGAVLGFILTVLIFTYIIGDNPFFRFAIHLFIGVASGFALVVVFYNVFWNQVFLAIIEQPSQALLMAPALLAGVWLLVTKSVTRLSRLGNWIMAFLVGAGAATAIGGAVLGTLFPQIGATGSLFDMGGAQGFQGGLAGYLFRGLIILAGTLTTLIYFHFGVRTSPDGQQTRHPLVQELARVGQVFIAITFGVLFAGVYAAALASMIERLNFIVEFLRPILPTL